MLPHLISWWHEPPPQPGTLSGSNGSPPHEGHTVFQKGVARTSYCHEAWRLWPFSPRLEGRLEAGGCGRTPCWALWPSLKALFCQGAVGTEEDTRRSRGRWLLGRLLDTRTTHPCREALDPHGL